ncbi:MAG: 50S ribosomal protein L25 [Parcubacteria group bacterium]
MLTLKAEARGKSEKLDMIRKTGRIPAILYGKKEASTPISISKKDFTKVWGEAGESTVVTLETPDGEKESLIHDIDIDPITGEPRHADFYVFEKGHKVTVGLPIEFEGVSPAVKERGGVLVKVLHEIEVEAMPKDLPSHIIIDISVFKNIGDQILAQDLRLPTGVTLTENPEEVIALVAEPKEEEEEESAPIDLDSIEVEKKGKEDGEEGEKGEGEKTTEE